MDKFNNLYHSYFKGLNKYLILFVFLFCSLSHSQKNSSDLLKHIENEIIEIKNKIANKDFSQALIRIENIENYSSFIEKKENRLEIDLLKSKIYYGNGEKEKSLDLLLTNMEELQTLDLAIKGEYSMYLGDIFFAEKNYSKSLSYFNESLNYYELSKDTLGIINSSLSLGKTYYRDNSIDSAITYFKQIIEYNINDRTGAGISKAFNNLSIISRNDEDFELARSYGEKSLNIKEQLKDTVGIAVALISLSNIDYIQKNFEKVEENYLTAFNYVENIKTQRAIDVRENVLYNLAYINEELGNYKKAYEYLERASNFTDSISKINTDQNISEIEAKYNVAKEAQKTEEERSKRLEAESKKLRAQSLFYGTALAFLALLALAYIFYRNYRLKQQAKLDHIENESQTKIINATIDAKEKERKAIAETLHDSVSALLSSANLHLQATKAQLKQKSPQEITKAQTIVNEASVKIRDLSHELISSVLLKFGLAFAVHDMCQKYSNSELTLHSDDDGIKRYHQDFEIKIHNIIEELINNILKHSKASNATIMLAHKENDMLSVRISDDGVGFNPRQARGKDGLGLSHIEARIKVMKGVFNIISLERQRHQYLYTRSDPV